MCPGREPTGHGSSRIGRANADRDRVTSTAHHSKSELISHSSLIGRSAAATAFALPRRSWAKTRQGAIGSCRSGHC